MDSAPLLERLREGCVCHRKRWSGDTHDDLGGTINESATDALLAEAADVIAELYSERAQLIARAVNAEARAEQAEAALSVAQKDAERLDYIERTFSGMTNRERYLPVQMIWGKGAMGRTLREACDGMMARHAAIAHGGAGEGEGNGR